MRKPLLILALLLFPFPCFAGWQNFHPYQTVILSATTTSSSATFTSFPSDTLQLDCWNSGSVAVFLAGARTSATAVVPTGTPALNGYHLGAGIDKVMDFGSADTVAAITSTGSATVYCSNGYGE